MGVFRYLNQRYGLTPEHFQHGFAMPFMGSSQHPSLFDQVFNPPHWLNAPLTRQPAAGSRVRHKGSVSGLWRSGPETTPQSTGVAENQCQAIFRRLAGISRRFPAFTDRPHYPQCSDCQSWTTIICASCWGAGYHQRWSSRAASVRQQLASGLSRCVDATGLGGWLALMTTVKAVQQLRQQLLLESTLLPSSVQQRLTQVEAVLQRIPTTHLWRNPHSMSWTCRNRKPVANPLPTPGMCCWPGLLRVQSACPRATQSGQPGKRRGLHGRQTIRQPEPRCGAQPRHSRPGQADTQYAAVRPTHNCIFQEEIDQLLKDYLRGQRGPPS